MKSGGMGGANTRTGLLFEKRIDILRLLKSKDGYHVRGNSILYHGEEVAKNFKKNALYKYLESQKIDYKKDADPVKIERQLMEVVPKSDWFALTYLLIDHGRALCKAQKPHCGDCVLSGLCPASRYEIPP